jgi:hypothetical protein
MVAKQKKREAIDQLASLKPTTATCHCRLELHLTRSHPFTGFDQLNSTFSVHTPAKILCSQPVPAGRSFVLDRWSRQQHIQLEMLGALPHLPVDGAMIGPATGPCSVSFTSALTFCLYRGR